MITSYHRPHDLDEAVRLITERDAVPLGGGTSLTTDRGGTPTEVVDLQALGLAGFDAHDGVVRVGSMTTLQAIADADEMPEVVRDAARREEPRSLRNAATIGGAVAGAHPESELVAALVAFGARATVVGGEGTSEHAVVELLADPALLSGRIVTAVSFATGGRAAADRTGRTPMDRPIVSVVAHRSPDGTRVAASGVAPHVVLVAPDAVADLDPPPDFRGSAEYRRHLASVLVGRVLARIGGQR